MKDAEQKCLSAKRDSRFIEFKERLDPEDAGELTEALKDIVALANSGGGIMGIGVDNHGSPTGADLSKLLNFDPAKLTDKLRSYTGEHFSGFEIKEAQKEGVLIVLLTVDEAESPIVFEKVGSYKTTEGKRPHCLCTRRLIHEARREERARYIRRCETNYRETLRRDEKALDGRC